MLKELHAFIELHASELDASLPMLCIELSQAPVLSSNRIAAAVVWSQKHVLACKGHNFTEDGPQLRTFKLFRRLYKYSSEQGTFQQLPAMPRHLPDQICRALESLRLVNTAGMLFHS